MPLPTEQRVRFYVYVIESPSAVDLYHRRSEGEIIQQAAKLNEIPCIVKTAISLQAFEASLKIGLKESMTVFTDRIPIIHISAHGDSEGIQLSNGDVIDWRHLKEHLRPINSALNNSLLVCMSCCEGYSGIRMAMHIEDPDFPFLALVGNPEKPSWAETAVAYTAFYHLLAKGEYIKVATEGMCAASGNKNFFVNHARAIRKGYLEHINKIDSEKVQQDLQQNIESLPPERLAKLRAQT